MSSQVNPTLRKKVSIQLFIENYTLLPNSFFSLSSKKKANISSGTSSEGQQRERKSQKKRGKGEVALKNNQSDNFLPGGVLQELTIQSEWYGGWIVASDRIRLKKIQEK